MNEFEENNNETAETEETGKKSIAKEIWEWVYTLAIAIIIAMLIKGFLFDIVRVDGSSMFPTLVNNDRLIVTKLGYKPAQGDIIILDSEYKNREEFYDKLAVSKDKDELSVIDKALVQSKLPSNLKKKYYVKRIIAMPGQTVDLVDGKVYVDGTPLDEPASHHQLIPQWNTLSKLMTTASLLWVITETIVRIAVLPSLVRYRLEQYSENHK